MDVKKELMEYLKGLYLPKSKQKSMVELLDLLKRIKLRLPCKDDAYRIGMVTLIIRTQGKGTRESFQGYETMFVDFDKVGKKYSIAYVRNAQGQGYVKRLDITSLKNTIII